MRREYGAAAGKRVGHSRNALERESNLSLNNGSPIETFEDDKLMVFDS
jgi:hypothetical protein